MASQLAGANCSAGHSPGARDRSQSPDQPQGRVVISLEQLINPPRQGWAGKELEGGRIFQKGKMGVPGSQVWSGLGASHSESSCTALPGTWGRLKKLQEDSSKWALKGWGDKEISEARAYSGTLWFYWSKQPTGPVSQLAGHSSDDASWMRLSWPRQSYFLSSVLFQHFLHASLPCGFVNLCLHLCLPLQNLRLCGKQSNLVYPCDLSTWAHGLAAMVGKWINEWPVHPEVKLYSMCRLLITGYRTQSSVTST